MWNFIEELFEIAQKTIAYLKILLLLQIEIITSMLISSNITRKGYKS